MILFIRHGQTKHNVRNLIAGAYNDIPLDRTGKRQAKQAAEKLKDVKIDIVICSPLKRARQTANAILKYHKDATIYYDERIRERDWGEFENKSDPLVPKNVWILGEILPESVERVDAFYERVKLFYEEVIERFKDKTVLVVAHKGVARMSGIYFHGGPKDNNFDLYALDNAEFCKLMD